MLSVNRDLTSCEDLAICDDKHVTTDINTVMLYDNHVTVGGGHVTDSM